jgi:chemotaxis protein methyltransferase CheR
MLTDAEISLIAREVKARSGAVLTREMGGAIEIRLQPMARREGFASVSDLIAGARLRPGGALWASVADALAQSETRFFRDRAQFAKLRSEVLPDALTRRGHERVRIWSAACSTGQEAYSVAMIAEDLRAEGINAAVEIVATDFSERLLDKARAGLYTQFEVQRGLPIRKLVAYFEKAGDLWRIADRMRAGVRFESHNLLKHPGALGRFDIILLAHVLASFDAETRLGVIARTADMLNPGGVMMFGAGETLPEGCEGLVFEAGLVRKSNAVRRVA